jgi:hypothetical protein
MRISKVFVKIYNHEKNSLSLVDFLDVHQWTFIGSNNF